MKEGIYIRILPFTGDYRFYLYHDGILLCLDNTALDANDIDWHKSMFSKPSRELGFTYVKELSE